MSSIINDSTSSNSVGTTANATTTGGLLNSTSTNNNNNNHGGDGGASGGGGGASSSDIDDQLDSTSIHMASGTEDDELEEFKARVREMEEEAEKLKQMQDDIIANSTQTEPQTILSPEEKQEIDARSIFVGNVDYSATADDLEKHFHGCGSINRVTILCDKYSGHPKGFAYIEFADKDSVETATALDDSLFKGRQIKVCAKRTNRPGLSTTNRPPRGGRGGYGGGGGGGGYGGRGYGRGRGGGFGPQFGGGGYHRGRGRGFRSRGWHGYSPY